MNIPWRDIKFWHAVALLVGTMVGVGIFGIPFVFTKAGFLVGALWLVVIAGVVMMFNMLFAELILRTSGTHQLVGYASVWLGPWGRRMMTFVQVLSLYTALLAYIIVVGEFLHNVLSHVVGVNPQFYGILFAVGWSLLWFLRVRTIATVELVMAGVYVAVVALLGVISVPHIVTANFSGLTPEYWYLPYGVLLFALSGMSAIPLQRQLLVGRERLMVPAGIVAVGFTSFLYLFFAFIVVGVSGDITTPEAIGGLFGVLRTPAIIVGSILGILTISTSYLMLGTALFETFTLDYRLRPITAWLFTLLPPLVLFWSGLRNFIDVIGLGGAVASGIIGVMISAAYLRARRHPQRDAEFRVRIPRVAVWCLMIVFALGAVYEFWVR